MEKTFIIRDNELIINVGTSQERNLTTTKNECSVCVYDNFTCIGNRKGKYCDMVTVNNDYEEIFID